MFNFWKTPLIKNLEQGQLPAVEASVGIDPKTILYITIAILVIVVAVIIAKKV